MSNVHNSKLVLDAATTAQISDPLLLDWKHNSWDDRGIAGSLTNGDSISLQVSPSPASVSGEVWVTIATFTSTLFAGNFSGVWPRVRVEKVGANGAASVWIVG